MAERDADSPVEGGISAGEAEVAASDAPGRHGLLATKIDVPRFRTGHLHRGRLVDQLDQALNEAVVLVSAPAGFGKSSLVAEWARDVAAPVAWLSLDADDNDPVRFWRYVAAAIGRVSSGFTDHVRGIVQPSGVVTVAGVVSALSDTVCAEPAGLTLVMDDYHVIESMAIHNDVALLLERRPDRFRVVLCTRGDPPMPLPRLRAHGQLVELRAADLRFTRDEAATVLRDSWGLDLSVASIEALAGRTEGWIVGLQLAAIALRREHDVEAAVRAFAGTHRFVLDYLSDEVLERQASPVKEFLLRCSILDRLSASLCDAVTGGGDSQEMLEELERANLFLFALDDQRGWYRFHHLFADLLREKLRRARPGLEQELHRLAAGWYEQHGPPDAAVKHALAAGDATWAARLVERHVDELLLRSEGATMMRWITALPRVVVESRARLLIAQARFNIYESRLEGTDELLDIAEVALADMSSEPYEPSGMAKASPLANLGATHTLLRAFVAHLRGDAEAAAGYASTALADIADDEWALRGIAEANLATAEWLSGRLDVAEKAMAENLSVWRRGDEPGRAAWSLHYLGQIQRCQGKLDKALETYETALEVGTVPDQAPEAPVGVAHIGMAAVAYERNEIAKARQHAIEGVLVARRFVHTLPVASGLATLAMVCLADGDRTGAIDVINEAGHAVDPSVADLLNPAPVVRARLMLASGDVTAAARWADERGLGADDDPYFPTESAHLVLARILLAQGRPDDASSLLERLRGLTVHQNRDGSVLEIDVLRSLAVQAQGDRPRALAILAEALERAEPDGRVRLFVDEGRPMAALLRGAVRVRSRHDATALSGPAREHAMRLLRELRPARVAAGRLTSPDLIEPLTSREIEVLQLLSHGRRNKQIAADLFITLDTVKKHVSHIYTKLGVTSRTEALARARELDLLP